jgi:hypothetical protein
MALSNELKIYQLYDQFTIVESAALIFGISPSKVGYDGWNGGGYYLQGEYPDRQNEFDAILGALLNALEEPNNGTETKVTTENIKEWLISKDWPSEFFGTGENQPQPIKSGYIPPYLDPKHEHYSHELATAVYAWLAFDGVNANGGESAKRSVKKWINDNLASRKFSINAIERMGIVTNWKKIGGAPGSTSKRANPKTLEELQACFKPIQPIAEKKTVKLKPMNYMPPPSFEDEIPY